jgi:hypothetical protein
VRIKYIGPKKKYLISGFMSAHDLLPAEYHFGPYCEVTKEDHCKRLLESPEVFIRAEDEDVPQIPLPMEEKESAPEARRRPGRPKKF